MITDEARVRMLAALAAAGIGGLNIYGEDFPWMSEAEHKAFIAALHALEREGVAGDCGGGIWRLSDREFARRILCEIGVARADREHVLIDAVVSVLRGAS